MSKGFQEIEREMLADMIARRNLLNGAIAGLEERLAQPPYVSNLDFGEIERIARKDMEFLEECERKREEANK